MSDTLDSHVATLETLLDERAIHRLLLTYCRAVDRVDLELLRSVYAPDARIEHGPFVGNAEDFYGLVRQMAGPESPYRSTQHLISNVTITLNRGPGADAETYFHAFHRREVATGAYDEFVGGRYIDHFERVNGHWRIAHRRTVFDWSRIEPGVPTFWEQVGAPGFLFGTRDRADPSYLE